MSIQTILHLIGSNCVGGPEKQILYHAADLQQLPGNTYQIEVGSFHDQPARPEILLEAEKRGLGTVCLGGALRPRLMTELVAALRARKIDLLCTHGFKANVLGYLASRRSPVPHAAFLRGWTAENMRVRFYEVLERQALARAQTVVCVSALQATQVARLRGPHRSAPVVIQNAMLPPFDRSGLGPPPTRASLGIPSGAFVFGSVGRLSIEKGHRFLVEAFATLRSRQLGRPAFLLVVGDGREQPLLEAQAAALGLEGQVYFAGYQGNAGEWMRLMDALVQPSLTEGTPNSVLEALLLGLPVIATAVGGVPDLILDRENGLLVSPGGSAPLAEAMSTLMASPELAAQLVAGAAGVKHAYSTERQRERLLALYTSILG